MVAGTCFALAWPATAGAASPPAFGVPVPVLVGDLVGGETALDGSVVAVAADGESRPGHVQITLARRPAVVNQWTAPLVLADEAASALSVDFDRNPLGNEIVGWVPAPDRPGETRVRYRSRIGLDAAFGPTQEVLLPARLPAAPANAGMSEDTRTSGGLAVAVAADGGVALALCDIDQRAGVDRALVWFAAPGGDGRWTTMGRCTGGPVRLGSDALGGIDLLWSGPPEGAASAAPNVVWAARRMPGAGGFGPRTPLSDPAVQADDGSAPPTMLTLPGGSEVALWNARLGGAGAIVADTAFVARRAVDGSWSPGEAVSRDGTAFRPSLAASPLGSVAVVWNVGLEVGGTIAGPVGPFGAPFRFPVEGAVVEAMPAALDSLGDVLVTQRGGPDGLVAYVRHADGTATAATPVLGPGVGANATSISTDPFGNGVLVTAALHDRRSVVVAVPYSAAPPSVSALALTSQAVELTVGEPARLGVEVLAGSRSTTLRATVSRAGRARLPLTGRARSLLRARSARVIVRARDAGPRVRTVRRTAAALKRAH